LSADREKNKGGAGFQPVSDSQDERSFVNGLLMPLKILNRALMFLGGSTGFERAEISSFAGFRVLFSRI
jgi:hypothetical protein